MRGRAAKTRRWRKSPPQSAGARAENREPMLKLNEIGSSASSKSRRERSIERAKIPCGPLTNNELGPPRWNTSRRAKLASVNCCANHQLHFPNLYQIKNNRAHPRAGPRQHRPLNLHRGTADRVKASQKRGTRRSHAALQKQYGAPSGRRSVPGPPEYDKHSDAAPHLIGAADRRLSCDPATTPSFARLLLL
jgi:hypothetical protein